MKCNEMKLKSCALTHAIPKPDSVSRNLTKVFGKLYSCFVRLPMCGAEKKAFAGR